MALPVILALMATIGQLQAPQFTTLGRLVCQATTSISLLVVSTTRTAQALAHTVSPSVVWRTRLDKNYDKSKTLI